MTSRKVTRAKSSRRKCQDPELRQYGDRILKFRVRENRWCLIEVRTKEGRGERWEFFGMKPGGQILVVLRFGVLDKIHLG